MSALDTAMLRPQRAPEAQPDRARHLTPVTTRPKRRPKIAYGLVALVGAILIAAAQMGLSIATTQATFEASQLNGKQRELTTQAQVLQDEVAGLSSPQYLAANAASLGMVIGASPTYIRLSDGAIIGTGQAAPGASTVDAQGRAAVSNALVTNVPLATAPGITMGGAPVVDEHQVSGTPTDGVPLEATEGTVDPAAGEQPVEPAAPPVADTIPTPSTR